MLREFGGSIAVLPPNCQLLALQQGAGAEAAAACEGKGAVLRISLGGAVRAPVLPVPASAGPTRDRAGDLRLLRTIHWQGFYFLQAVGAAVVRQRTLTTSSWRCGMGDRASSAR